MKRDIVDFIEIKRSCTYLDVHPAHQSGVSEVIGIKGPKRFPQEAHRDKLARPDRLARYGERLLWFQYSGLKQFTRLRVCVSIV